MPNSVDPDQLASSEGRRSGSTLFAKAVHIWVQRTWIKIDIKKEAKKLDLHIMELYSYTIITGVLRALEVYDLI